MSILQNAGLLSTSTCAQSNIAPVMAGFEMDLCDRFVDVAARCFDGRSKRGDRQNAAAGRDDLSIYALRSSMENLNVRKFGRFIQTRNRFSSVVFIGITAGCEDDRHASAFVPLDRVIVDLAVDRGLEQWQQIGFHARQDCLRLRVAEAAIELEDTRAFCRNHEAREEKSAKFDALL